MPVGFPEAVLLNYNNRPQKFYMLLKLHAESTSQNNKNLQAGNLEPALTGTQELNIETPDSDEADQTNMVWLWHSRPGSSRDHPRSQCHWQTLSMRKENDARPMEWKYKMNLLAALTNTLAPFIY